MVFRKAILLFGLIFWVTSIAFAMKVLIDYSKIPGPEGTIVRQWPVHSSVQRDPSLPTLVMSVHSMCSCTRASIEELSRIMTVLQGKLIAHVLIVPLPGQTETELRDTFVWKRSAETPGVFIHIDQEGLQTKQFGALVSGKVMVFDTQGKLSFHGGITDSRGHEGENAGRKQIISLILDKVSGKGLVMKTTPVFGCLLFDPKE